MWRYLAGGIAALLMVAVGWMIFNGQARPDRRVDTVAAAWPSPQEDMSPGLPEAPERSREQKRFDRYDKDRDGRITRDEYLAARRKAFAKLDTDHDGRLSFEEWGAKTIARFATADRDGSRSMDATEFATTAPKRRTRPACRCAAPAAED